MAKYDWGFDLINKETSTRDGFLVIEDRATGNRATFALGNNADHGWGDIIRSSIPRPREDDAISALEVWGWI